MKGVVFNLLEQAVSAEHGAEVWDELLDAAGLEGVYTAVGTYPDEELNSLVGAACAKLGVEPDDAVRWFGRSALPLLAARYPVFFDKHSDARSFVLTLNEVIHPEVRKLFPGAYAPEFDFDTASDGSLVLGYTSHRGLCTFAEGLLEGAAAHYGEHVEIEQLECSKRGGDRCVFSCKFMPGT